MNTPAHILVNLAIFTRPNRAKVVSAIALGAFFPDIPIFLFYFYEKVILGNLEGAIWGVNYNESPWHILIQYAHSFVITGALGVVCYFKKWRYFAFFFASMFFHSVFDFPVHHDDAHSHFLPISQYKFQSPLSYWDPRHYGQYFMIFESVLVLVLFFRLQKKSLKIRTWVALSTVFYFVGISYAFWAWVAN